MSRRILPFLSKTKPTIPLFIDEITLKLQEKEIHQVLKEDSSCGLFYTILKAKMRELGKD